MEGRRLDGAGDLVLPEGRPRPGVDGPGSQAMGREPAHGSRVPDALARRARVHHRRAARLPARPAAARAPIPHRASRPRLPPSAATLGVDRLPGARQVTRRSAGAVRRRRAKTAPTRSIYGQKGQPILAAVNGVVTAVEEGDPLLAIGERHDQRHRRPHVPVLRVQRRHAWHQRRCRGPRLPIDDPRRRSALRCAPVR